MESGASFSEYTSFSWGGGLKKAIFLTAWDRLISIFGRHISFHWTETERRIPTDLSLLSGHDDFSIKEI